MKDIIQKKNKKYLFYINKYLASLTYVVHFHEHFCGIADRIPESQVANYRVHNPVNITMYGVGKFHICETLVVNLPKVIHLIQLYLFYFDGF